MDIQEINKQAEIEGWGIYDCTGAEDGDGYRLQKIDESNIFTSDKEAMKHVYKQQFRSDNPLYFYAFEFTRNNCTIDEFRYLLLVQIEVNNPTISDDECNKRAHELIGLLNNKL